MLLCPLLLEASYGLIAICPYVTGFGLRERNGRAGFRFVGTPRSSSAHLLSDANGKLGPRPATRYPPHHSDSLDPQRVMEITFEVARLGESLSQRHQDTEKTSRPER